MPQYDAYEDPLPELPGDIIIVESTSFTALEPIEPPIDINHQGPRVKGAHEGARIKSGAYDESHNDPFHSQMTSHGRGPHHVARQSQAASSPTTVSETEKRDLAAEESLRQEDDDQVRMALEGDARKFGDHHHHPKGSEARK